MSSEYVSSINRQLPPIIHNSRRLIYQRTMNTICSHRRVEILKSFISLISLLSILQIYSTSHLGSENEIRILKFRTKIALFGYFYVDI